ncbi:hypothetical protein AC249_AIPGENE17310 [Exaiptasia diaphana]|nr:hypothetical protein AC249_AIPGENE17310 [Exaiptasia diaphana]
MCYFSGNDLSVGKVYTLKRNKANKNDTNCLEIREVVRPRAVINREIAKLISPLLDNGKLHNADCEVIEEAKWSRGDTRTPARAHKVKVGITFTDKADPEIQRLLELLKKEYKQES